MPEIISGDFTTNVPNIIAGYSMLCDRIIFKFETDPSKPTTFIIDFSYCGYIPTGNNIHAYKNGTPDTKLPIIGIPIIDYINKTLTVVVAGNSTLQTNDQCIITFEAKKF